MLFMSNQFFDKNIILQLEIPYCIIYLKTINRLLIVEKSISILFFVII